jgi:arylsulfatase A-like enzyme
MFGRKKSLPWLVPALLLVAGPVLGDGPKAERPNIVVIVSDDQGYADATFQGQSKEVPTPHLDALARSGVTCTRGYVTAPVCSPSRAGLMTGRYQQRFGHHNNLVAEASKPIAHLPLAEVTLAQALGEAGYRTALVGKWHLGLQDRARPYERGFADFFGIITGGHDYFQNDPSQRPMRDADYKARLERNGLGEKVSGYLTDAFGDEAVRVIRENTERPFFLYLAFNAPHTPTQAPDDLIDAVPPTVTNAKRRTYIAQIAAMDRAIGRVVEALRETHADQKTLIVFFSDNGGAKFPYYDNTPLRDAKGSLYEGGIRVPFVASYPGHIPAGSLCNQPVTSLDVFATACTLAGATPRSQTALDSRDMLPVLEGSAKEPTHDTLYWDFPSFGAAVSRGDLKLIVPKTGAPELYNLADDLPEAHNLADAQPETVASLAALLAEWQAHNAKPLWGPGSEPEKK